WRRGWRRRYARAAGCAFAWLVARAALVMPVAVAEPVPAVPVASGGASDWQPSPKARAKYETVVREAIAEFDARRWPEARALFRKAHGIWPSARTYRSLGMTAFELRDYPTALHELGNALSDPRRPLSASRRGQVEALIERTRMFVGRLRVIVQPRDAELLIDGKDPSLSYSAPAGACGDDRGRAKEPLETADESSHETCFALLLPAGQHTVLARASGHHDQRQAVTIAGGEASGLLLNLAPLPEATASAANAIGPARPGALAPVADPEDGSAGPLAHPGVWVAGGAAVSLGIASAVLWFASDSSFDSLRTRCRSEQDGCSDADLASWRTLQTSHHVTLGLSIAAGTVAVVWFLLHEQGGPRAPSVAPTARGARWVVRF
ncbi:MAG: hypothetical protein OXR73_27565, partial [Myxococcales bacterium]|nr:hypothetical protein [Myxococcales bacterium]